MWSLIFETLFFFVPLLGIASIPLGLAVIAFDRLLYGNWVPVMRAKISERKWPAYIIAFAPVALLPTLEFLEQSVPLPLTQISTLKSGWLLALGTALCVAFAACWLKLPEEDPEDLDAPPARSLTGEWLLAVGLLAANYVGFRCVLGLGWW